ncbi:MAG: hypothetical protein KGO53_06730 [Alphaproteobacteria bacterium]|nr:hypothetical protein [Alphaproteobacteria bacterium]
MTRRFLIDAFAWGFALWLFGYVLGMLLFAVVPVSLIGWVITPFALALTLWVAFRKLHPAGMGHYLGVAAAWLAIAVLGDYAFIVKLLNPADGYYKLDVYLYYALTALIPLAAGHLRAPQKP